MRKILIFIAFIFAITPTMLVSAFDVQVGEEVYVTQESGGDLYVAGGRVDVNAPVNGDLVIAGGELNILSAVKEDILITGGDIVISGNVGDDIRAAGGTVKIYSHINGDVVIGAGDVRIGKDVIINGNLVVGAGRVFLDGRVQGDVNIAAGELVLNGVINGEADLSVGKFKNPGKTGRIIGNLNYKGDEKVPELENIAEGGVLFTQNMIKEEVKENLVGMIASYIVIKIFGALLFAALIYFYFEKLFAHIALNLKKQKGKSFLYGFVTIIGAPVIILLLFISIIGIPFALFTLFAYIFLFVFLSLINIVVISAFIIGKYKIKIFYQKLLILLGFTLLFIIINGINIIVGFFTLGAIGIRVLEEFHKLRKG